MRRAVFPGSFDPITLGHKNIIDRSISLFDEIIIAVGMYPEKKYMFPLKVIMKLLKFQLRMMEMDIQKMFLVKLVNPILNLHLIKTIINQV